MSYFQYLFVFIGNAQSDDEVYASASDQSAVKGDDSDIEDQSRPPSEIPPTDEDELVERDSEYEKAVKRRISKRRSHYEAMPSSESEEDESGPIDIDETLNDSEDNEIIEQALSPRTRMSITGT